MKKFFLILLFPTVIFSQVIDSFVASKYNKLNTEKTVDFFKNRDLLRHNLLDALIKKDDLKEFIYNQNGGFSQLIDVTFDGFPLYISIDNIDAAISTRTNFMHGIAPFGLDMEGQSMTVGVWDGGKALTSHNEFKVSSTNNSSRMTGGDSGLLNDNSFHATHVAGTVGSRGNDVSSKGMAPKSNIITYDWVNDESEVVAAASNGLLVSNHSYGIPMYNSSGTFNVPDWLPGCYSSDSRDWDIIHYNFPYYLMVVSAGNEGSRVNPHTFRTGFDKLVGNKTSKNNLVIANTQDADVNVFSGLLNNPVAINSSSSQGPSDDYRVKPDISGNGTGLYSTLETSNTAYGTLSGTSMAAPNVAGSIILLQQYYFSFFSDYMKSSTLRGLVCHSADDAGNIGPDPVFGWGLLNMKIASDIISDHNSNLAIIDELTLSQLDTYSFNFTLNTTENLKATICWTDIPGPANNGTLNSTTPSLVNDLDLRIIKDGVEVFLPWKLNPSNISTSIKADNNVDNIEVVSIDNALPGSYEVIVSHKGLLTDNSQDFSLIFSGNNFSLSSNVFESEVLTLYPNPSSSFLNLNAGKILINKIEIFDIQSRSINSKVVLNESFVTINTSELPNGVYFVKIFSGESFVVKKFIKN
jgi:hypothetical protein